MRNIDCVNAVGALSYDVKTSVIAHSRSTLGSGFPSFSYSYSASRYSYSMSALQSIPGSATTAERAINRDNIKTIVVEDWSVIDAPFRVGVPAGA